MEKLFWDNEYSKVTYNSETKVGSVIWKSKTAPFEDYKAAFNVLIEYAKTHDFYTFLSDTRDQGVVSPENRTWFQKDAIPRALSTGLKRGAVIISGNVFKRYYMNLIIKTLKKFKLDIKLFDTPENAMKWILSFND